MKALISFYSKGKFPAMVADSMKKVFEDHGIEIIIHEIIPKIKTKESDYTKMDSIELVNNFPNLKNFDLIVLGSTVWSFSPSPVISSVLRNFSDLKGKRFALFCTCVLPGTTLKKMSSILATKNAKVIASTAIQSIFEVDTAKLKDAKQFAESLVLKMQLEEKKSSNKKLKK